LGKDGFLIFTADNNIINPDCLINNRVCNGFGFNGIKLGATQQTNYSMQDYFSLKIITTVGADY
jgi:hypothetical protein